MMVDQVCCKGVSPGSSWLIRVALYADTSPSDQGSLLETSKFFAIGHGSYETLSFLPYFNPANASQFFF